MANTETKIIQCTSCGDDIEVGKFASKKQKCAKCTKAPATPASPRQKLEKAQRLLQSLGFTMNEAGKWGKSYSDANGVSYRLEPYFHKGSVKGMEDCTIEAFQIVSQRMVMLKPTAAHAEEQWAAFQEKVPTCTHDDMAAIWESLLGMAPPTTEEHQAAETTVCSKCGKAAIEFVLSGKERKPVCLKCFGITSKVAAKLAAG
jgi:hypothetical protein